MAGDWIKMTVSLSTSPKVVRISSACNADECPPRVRVVGALHAVWCLFDQHSTDGKLRGYTLKMIDEVIGWPGFAKAMADAEWIRESPQGIEMPEFETHNGAPAKRRVQEADRKRNVRKTSASEADEKRTREEKRREELQQPPLAPPDGKKPNGNGEHRARKKSATRAPDSFEITEPMWAWATGQGVVHDRIEAETAKFLDHHKAKDSAFSDWPAAWRKWMRNVVEFSRRPH